MNKYLIISCLLVLLTGCMQTRYITEQHIKNNVEQHNKNEFSTIRTYTIYKGRSYGSSEYIELTGYKYRKNKALVIGADSYYNARKKFENDNTIIADITYLELSLSECQSILDNYKVIRERIEKEMPKFNEEIYHDYTVSDDLFISFRKARFKTYGTTFINFWIDGEKYSVPTRKIMRKLEKFMKY